MSSRELTIVLLVIIGVVVLLLFLVMSFWGGGMMGSGAMMGPGMMGSWGFGSLFLLLVIAGVILVVLSLIRKNGQTEDALQTLRVRLARGEISKEQFEELKEALEWLDATTVDPPVSS